MGTQLSIWLVLSVIGGTVVTRTGGSNDLTPAGPQPDLGDESPQETESPKQDKGKTTELIENNSVKTERSRNKSSAIVNTEKGVVSDKERSEIGNGGTDAKEQGTPKESSTLEDGNRGADTTVPERPEEPSTTEIGNSGADTTIPLISEEPSITQIGNSGADTTIPLISEEPSITEIENREADTTEPEILDEPSTTEIGNRGADTSVPKIPEEYSNTQIGNRGVHITVPTILGESFTAENGNRGSHTTGPEIIEEPSTILNGNTLADSEGMKNLNETLTEKYRHVATGPEKIKTTASQNKNDSVETVTDHSIINVTPLVSQDDRLLASSETGRSSENVDKNFSGLLPSNNTLENQTNKNVINKSESVGVEKTVDQAKTVGSKLSSLSKAKYGLQAEKWSWSKYRDIDKDVTVNINSMMPADSPSDPTLDKKQRANNDSGKRLDDHKDVPKKDTPEPTPGSRNTDAVAPSTTTTKLKATTPSTKTYILKSPSNATGTDPTTETIERVDKTVTKTDQGKGSESRRPSNETLDSEKTKTSTLNKTDVRARRPKSTNVTAPPALKAKVTTLLDKAVTPLAYAACIFIGVCLVASLFMTF